MEAKRLNQIEEIFQAKFSMPPKKSAAFLMNFATQNPKKLFENSNFSKSFGGSALLALRSALLSLEKLGFAEKLVKSEGANNE